ncbi:hypothetical protein [Alicyclobacillus dauci]|uniref:Uncharacterized protein n=1 Tax=Alicyclobacillus dauci TaxID=1475485 RepID=A0ABY6Z8K9_9BACL|nr:hypothetical protein [Alicyclobacillus dauci]WAH38390.1 hypothetical protein NZD86_07900 [Alicyclobacillus dauci]
MNNDNKSHMIKSQTVKQQLDQLEKENPTKNRNKKGSTNEIQPIETDDGITQ